MPNERYLIIASVALSAIITVYIWLGASETINWGSNPEALLSPVELPVVWGDMGARIINAGVIDRDKIKAIYARHGGFSDEEKQILEGKIGKLTITRENAGFILNMLWAFGLSNKNDILENGPMMDSRYGGAENFASTGGWTLAQGNVMDHYSKHSFVILTPEQQMLVEKISKNIYRPCCDNSTYFPDCNHGMAMLGLLELMASQGVSEQEMYKIALQVNTLWFPDTYITIAKYLKEKKNIDWANADPKTILGYNYSSGSGYQKILRQITPPAIQSGARCGI